MTSLSLVLQEKYQRAIALHQEGNIAAATALYREVLAEHPRHFGALHYLGVAACQSGQTESSLDFFEKAIEIDANVAELYSNYGIVLEKCKRYAAALAVFDQAIFLDSLMASAWSNRANSLLQLGRPEDSLESCKKALALQPDSPITHNNRGNALHTLKRFEEALAAFDEALRLDPGYADAWGNRGGTLFEMKRTDEALASFEQAIALDPDQAVHHVRLGCALRDIKRDAEARAAFEKALALKPDYPLLFGDYLNAGMKLCHWDGLSALSAMLKKMIVNGVTATKPFYLLSLSDDPALQGEAATVFAAWEYKPPKLPPLARRPANARIRVGYFSADFRTHVMGHLLIGLFGAHDTENFEFYGFYTGTKDEADPLHAHFAAFFGERFFAVREQRDEEIAQLSRDLMIDIAVDCIGYTKDGRLGVFHERAAPVQAAYLGYLGTTGGAAIDYLFADKTVIPETEQGFYSENIVYLPHCYQVNDSQREISDRIFTRAEAGLPESGFVFCCFNNPYKILPATFDGWMRILQAVEGSVLWLLGENPVAADNLRKEAALRGVAPERLVFTRYRPMDEYLAQHRLADLFIDTLPCNALATASYALWSGLPVLTQRGKTFVGRGAASMLQAVGLPELITESQAEFEAKAVFLALNPASLCSLKEKLAANRLTTPLFDTRRFARNIESAYRTMLERHEAGLPPTGFSVEELQENR